LTDHEFVYFAFKIANILQGLNDFALQSSTFLQENGLFGAQGMQRQGTFDSV